MDLLMGNDVNHVPGALNFFDNSSDASGFPWSSYGSTFASSDGFSEYSRAMPQYSLEGDNEAYSGSLMHGNDLFLPIPQLEIQTASPPPASPPAMLQSTDPEISNLKRPRAAVAADLDTANILPLEHRRKRVKPARADEQ
jgi:hypothetical protein